MDSLHKPVSSRERGAALIIVLALVVLLTGLMVAYVSRTTSDRQVAHSSFNQSKADQLAASAMDNIIGDLRQEIVNGSASPAPTVGSSVLYTPTSNANMLPMRSPTPTPGTTPAIPNLIRRSVRSDGIPAPAPTCRASAVNSTIDVSANGRSISLARWNSHYLIPKSNTADDKSDPITTGFTAPNYWAPDWAFVTNQGATVINSPNNSVIGRYAYAIYDEGGLLDMNLAGYPTGTAVSQYSGKRSLAFADLTALPSPGTISNPDASSIYQVDRLVGWRNYGTTQPTNKFPDSTPAGQAFARNFQNSSTAGTNFYNFVVSNPWGPLTVRSNPSPSPYPWNGRTDQIFLGRQELIAFRTTTQFSANALQYLGTFSREAAAGAPQWTGPSPTPTSTNPNFQALTVTGSFTRNDGTNAIVGDPLVNKPFLLQRLNWLTYKGPSGPSAANPTGRGTSVSEPDILILRNTYGITSTFLQQGTDANILKYFGLAWDTTNERWNYVGHSGGSSPISSIATFGPGGTQSATRELDFFELLQAGIILPSSVNDDNYSFDSTLLPVSHQQSKMLHLLTIGANLIAQSRADSYPVRIACSVGGTTMEAVGAPRLPYLNSLTACPVAGTSWTGGVNWFLVPNLWDPFRNTWDLTEATSGTPAYPRPAVRISVSGSVSIGTITNPGSVKSGNVPSASVTPSPSPAFAISGPTPQSLVLTTPTAIPTATPPRGRDGFLEASRIGTADCTPTPTPFTTTTSASPTPTAQWNNIPYPSPTPNPTPVGGLTNFVVFTISFPGSYIPGSWTSGTQNPVLILKPGFQMTLDYQSPNGTWYSYSFLQGNNATNTWINGSNSSSTQLLNLTTILSKYGRNPAPSPTASPAPTPTPYPTVLLSSSGVATPWNVATLAQAPMFAKADPRSIRYNSQIGVVNLPGVNPSPTPSAGVIGSIWPNGYAPTPPSMTTGSTPAPTPTITPIPTPTATPNPPNPATLGDNAPAGNAANLYDEVNGAGWRPVMMNRPFRSVGEMGYAFRDQPFRTLSFSSGSSSNPSPDAGLLELFSVNDYPTPSPTPTPSSTPTPTPRAGVINVNSRQGGALAAMLASTIRKENTLTPSLVSATDNTAVNTGTILSSLGTPVTNKAGLATLIAPSQSPSPSPSPSPNVLDPSVPKTERESVVRALGEADQARTWNLLIDVIAQSGRYPPNAASGPNTTNPLANFVVEGEQHYWVHVAIDRFTGQVIDKQIEVVKE